jgi:serine/threonine-protein kinase
MDGNQAPLDRLGGYRVLRRIATGGTSDVLLANAEGPLGFERQVVLKLLLSQYRDDDQFARMFAREAAAYARLSHSSIVRLFDFFSQNEQLVMVLEFVDGSPLNRLRAGLKDIGRKLTDMSSLYVADRVFDALSAAHGYLDASGNPSPVIHRDVNPSNVLVAWNGEVKLADFGIARVTGVRSDTQAGLIKGTFGYMAPEQVNGGDIGPHTDVYAAGILLWEMLAHRKAIQRGALPEIEILRAMAEPHIVSLDVLRPDLDRRIRDVVKATLEPDYRKRTITAEEVCRTLRDVAMPSAGRGELLELLRLAKDRDKVKKKLLSIPPMGGPEPSKAPAKALPSPKPPSVRPTASAAGQGSNRPPPKTSPSSPPRAPGDPAEAKKSAIDHVPAMLRPSTAPPAPSADGTEENLDLDKLFDGLALPEEEGGGSLAGTIKQGGAEGVTAAGVTLAGRDPDTVSSSMLELDPDDDSARELPQAPKPAAQVPRPPSKTEPLTRPVVPVASANAVPDTVRPTQDARSTLVGSPSDRPPPSKPIPPLPPQATASTSPLAKTAVSTQPMAAKPLPPAAPSASRTTVAESPLAKAGDGPTEPAAHADTTLAVASKSAGVPLPSATTTLMMGHAENAPTEPPKAPSNPPSPDRAAAGAGAREGFGSTQIMAQAPPAKPAPPNVSVLTPTPAPVPSFPSGVTPAPAPAPYVTKLDSGPGTILGGAAAPRPPGSNDPFAALAPGLTPGLASASNAPVQASPNRPSAPPPKKSNTGRIVAVLLVAALSAAGGVGYVKRARVLALIGKAPPVATASPSASASAVPTPSASDDLAVGFSASAGKEGGAETSLDASAQDARAEASLDKDASLDAAALALTPDAASSSKPDAAPSATASVTASASAAPSTPAPKTGSGMTAGPTTCIVNTASAQPGHRIFYDGRVVGETPAAVALPCGSHTIKLGSAGTPRTIDFPCGAEQAVGDR